MAKYLVKASYSSDGIRGVLKEGGSGRVAAVEQLAMGIGGSVEAFYFALGDRDVYLILDLPDNASAAAIAATVGASGALSSYETVVLLTPAEIDEAAKRAVNYRPPGGQHRGPQPDDERARRHPGGGLGVSTRSAGPHPSNRTDATHRETLTANNLRPWVSDQAWRIDPLCRGAESPVSSVRTLAGGGWRSTCRALGGCAPTSWTRSIRAPR